MPQYDVQILILAAGKGSRMKSDLPKPMHKIGDKTMLEMVIENASKISNNITIIYSQAIEPYLKDLPQNYEYDLVLQPNPLGTGHAVYCALGSLDISKPTMVLYADNPFINDKIIISIIEEFYRKQSDVIIMGFDRENPTGYGRILISDNGKVKKIIECKEASLEEKNITLCNSGIILFNTKVLKESIIQLMSSNINTEYYLTSLLEISYNKGYNTSCFISSEVISLGVNTQEELYAAQIFSSEVEKN